MTLCGAVSLISLWKNRKEKMGEKFRYPPRLPRWILYRFLPRSENTYLIGDFDEIYNSILESQGKATAHRWYWIQLFYWIPIIFFNSIRWSFTMFKNYLKITLRNLVRQKGYAFINIAGLSVGIACALLLILVVQYEFKYESHHENAGRIYRINIAHTQLDRTFRSTYSPVPLAPSMYEEVPEVTHFARIAEFRQTPIAHEEQKFYEDGVRFVDPGILEMFTFPLLAGDRATALKDANSIVITEDMAIKYFGKEDPLGKTLVILNSMSLKVTGVMRNHPGYTNIHPDFLVPIEKIRALYGDEFFQNWLSQQLASFVMLADGHSAADAEAKIQDAFNRHVREDDGRLLSLDQLRRMHLFSDTQPTGNINSLYILLAVGVLIVLVACINFMNLATARSAKRAKEVGLRKVVGAARRQLIRQFIGESMVYTTISMGFALFLAHAFLPALNSLTGQALEFGDITQTIILTGIVGLYLLVGFTSGSYPALFLSAVQPTKTLRGTYKTGTQGVLFRKVLVVSQFAISIILIISTMIIGRQLNFLLNKPLGFEKDGIVIIRNDRSTFRRNLQPLKTELLNDSRILGVTGSLALPSSIGMYNTVTWEGATENQEIAINHNRVDYDFLDTYEIELVAGRKFSPEFPADVGSDSDQRGPENSRSIIINQEALRQFGWDDPIGKKVIEVYGEERNYNTVIGVIKDFHFNSLRQSIRPLKLFLSADNNRYVSVKIRLEGVNETLKFVERAWKRIYPDVPFDYFFFDRVFEQSYRSESSMKRLFEYFSTLAVFIGCLGLLGLVSYAAERRSKEIGIRKVLGASSPQIVMLLSKEFTRWVVLANLFAWPAAYFAMRSWLNGFAYRISLNAQFEFFILAGALALTIALLTVAFQAIKAALSDPVKTLKYE
jgi:putative ABC transport system permease protein